MRRLSLPLLTLALAGVLLAACDLEREQEVGVRDVESAEDCPAVTVATTPTETPVAANPSETPTETPADGNTITPAARATASPVAAEETASADAIPSSTPGSMEASATAKAAEDSDSTAAVSPLENPPSATPVDAVQRRQLATYRRLRTSGSQRPSLWHKQAGKDSSYSHASMLAGMNPFCTHGKPALMARAKVR
jgi:hypothetical protein